MGRNTHAAFFNYVIHSIYRTNHVSYDSEIELMFCQPESLVLGEANFQTDDIEYPMALSKYEWDYKGDEDIEGIITYKWQKNNQCVYVANECPYQSGGSADMALIANEDFVLQSFIKDWQLDKKFLTEIKTNSMVKQTL